MSDTSTTTTVADSLSRVRDRHLDQLKQWLRIPSVSTDPERAGEVRRAAEWLRSRLAEAGCGVAEIHDTAGHPIVYGEWMGAPGKPTILVYGHYDVQPEDPIEQWDSPPFEPTVRDGRVYARGASDDKGQVIAHVNALEAHLDAAGTCPVNVKFLIEGEEEIGSPNLEPFLAAERDKLACDAVVISDTAMFSPKIPSVCCGLRGLAYLEVEVRGSGRDLHSGSFGGAVINPANALTQMLAALKDKKGRVTIPGFYDDVRRPAKAERETYRKLPHKDSTFRKAIGAPELSGEKGYSTLERIWTRPSLDINGVWGGFTGEGAKTVIPAVAKAKVSMRLVPGQRPADIERKFKRYMKKLAPDAVKVTVKDLHGGEPWVADPSHPALRAAGRALERAFGSEAVFVREGGSIPIVASFARVLKVPCVLMGFGLNDDNLHAPNEKLELLNFHRGNDAAAYLLDELGSMEAADLARASGGGKKKPRKPARGAGRAARGKSKTKSKAKAGGKSAKRTKGGKKAKRS